MKIANKNCTQFVNTVNKHNKMKPVELGINPITHTGFTTKLGMIESSLTSLTTCFR